MSYTPKHAHHVGAYVAHFNFFQKMNDSLLQANQLEDVVHHVVPVVHFVGLLRMVKFLGGKRSNFF
jgi:hypothetical protein